ncbi:MAG: sulfite exporter TauE/SafE family protein [bacterium]|nr:sulfite exporter TauE/SafE family protein [bacterium]
MDLVWMLLIGLGGGLAGGLLGIGGSIVMIPLMTLLFGPRQHLHQAVAMIVNFFVGAPAVFQHLRVRAVMPEVIKQMIPAAAVCVIVGVLVSELSIFTGERRIYLTGVFGLFLLGVAGADLRKSIFAGRNGRSSPSPQDALPVTRRAWMVGVPAGFLGGLLGVGGGFIAVPLQQRLLNLPLRNAIANSAATIVVLSAIGASFKNTALVVEHGVALWESVRLALMLIPGAILGSLIGARLTHVLPVRIVHAVFLVFLTLAAVRMLTYALSN